MPKINPTQKYPNQLTNGHTHLFMMNGKNLSWGAEAKLKYNLAKILAYGDRETQRTQKEGMLKHFNTDPACKIVYVLMGDSDPSEWIDEISIVDLDLTKAVDNNLPVIVVKGSPMCNSIIDHLNGKGKMHNEGRKLNNQVYEKLLDEGHFYALESGKSEDIAAFAHFFLTVTPYGEKKRDWQTDLGEDAKPATKSSNPQEKSAVKQKEPAREPSTSKAKPPAAPVDDGKSSKMGADDSKTAKSDSKDLSKNTKKK